MIQHFNQLQTPLQSIKRYTQLTDHERRFVSAGWESAVTRSLWDLFSDPSFVSVEERLALNSIEPFDEWEEFALFSSHYFLLETWSDSRFKSLILESCLTKLDRQSERGLQKRMVSNCVMQLEGSQSSIEHRRFGAVFEIGPGIIGCHGGLGDQRRLNNTSAYACSAEIDQGKLLPPIEIEARMCHTITRLRGSDCLLVGGRASPDRGMSDCWLRQAQEWQRIEDLPTPLYRHCATVVTRDEAEDSVLVFGGKRSGSLLSNSWLLWHKTTGWVQIHASDVVPGPRFGAAMIATGVNHGILVGYLQSFLFLSFHILFNTAHLLYHLFTRLVTLVNDCTETRRC